VLQYYLPSCYLPSLQTVMYLLVPSLFNLAHLQYRPLPSFLYAIYSTFLSYCNVLYHPIYILFQLSRQLLQCFRHARIYLPVKCSCTFLSKCPPLECNTPLKSGKPLLVSCDMSSYNVLKSVAICNFTCVTGSVADLDPDIWDRIRIRILALVNDSI
jgi:hypothetical protein